MAFGLLFAWPLARRWLAGADRLTAAVTAFGLSLGALSLWMLALALVPGALSLAGILALPAAVFVAGLILWRRAPSTRNKTQDPSLKTQGKQSVTFYALRFTDSAFRFTHYLALLTLAPLAVISVNVLYYPFYYADTLSRYGLFARRIFETGGLPASVQGYPLLVSLGYALAFFAAGGVNDRLAGLVSAAFALGTIGVTYALGCRMYGQRAGLAAAFLAATSTLFVVWGTSGYVDIPTGFFFGLVALFAYRWLESGSIADAWLAGIAAGLAIWTKQAGLAILPSLAGVLGLAVWQVESRRRMLIGLRGQRSELALGRPLALWDYLKDALRAGGIFLLAVVAIAGPWYARNYLLAGPAGVVPLPGAFYAAQADHRPAALLPFLTRASEWGWPFAALALAGSLWAIFEALAGERATATEAGGGRLRPLIVLAFILPYHLAWWWAFSYEVRFLLTLLPFYAVLAGRFVDWALARLARLGGLDREAAAPAPRAATLGLAGLCLALTAVGVWPRLGAVYHLAREPLASTHDIRLRLRPDQTLTVDYLRGHLLPDSDSVLLMDGSYEYFLTDYRTGVFYPVTLADVRDWDYVVVPDWAAGLYANLGHNQDEFWQSLTDSSRFRPVYHAPVAGGTTIYRILR